jgi:hypothetical protein
MYYLIKNNQSDDCYRTIKDLYYNEFLNIVLNFNFKLFNQLLKEYQIYNYLDNDGLKLGAIRNDIISDDEIDLLTDHELLLILNKCLLNDYKIKKVEN